MTQSIDWLTLSYVPGLGVKGYWRLVQAFGSPPAVFAATDAQLGAVGGVRPTLLAGLRQEQQLRLRAQEEVERLAAFGGKMLCYDHADYPELLRQISDPPPFLFLYGNETLLASDCVAIVGSRAATRYGMRTALGLGKSLAEHSLTTVSGLAYGIDTEAHSGALAAAGGTIAVLGCGLDIVYPAQNRHLYSRIREHGLLVSEYPLGTRPDGFRFPARNRIIAGLSAGVVVVEAAQKSGSLITAEFALEEGREVFAVPGQIDSYKSSGAHQLLQQGAKLVLSVQDIIEELWPTRTVSAEAAAAVGPRAESTLEPDARRLMQHMDCYPQPRDEIIRKSGFAVSHVNELLLLLELDGLVEVLPGDELRLVS